VTDSSTSKGEPEVSPRSNVLPTGSERKPEEGMRPGDLSRSKGRSPHDEQGSMIGFKKIT